MLTELPCASTCIRVMPISSWRATEKRAQNGLKRCCIGPARTARSCGCRARCATPTPLRGPARRGSSGGRRRRPEARRGRRSRTPARRLATGTARRSPASRSTSVPIRIVKPVRPSERCGVSSALKNGSSAAGRRFVSSMAGDYRRAMQKPKTKNAALAAKTQRRQRQAAAAPGAALFAVHGGRGARDLPALFGAAAGAEGRARARQRLHAAGRRRAVGAGHRRRRQQGDAAAVRRRRHAAKDAGARRGKGRRAISAPSACGATRRRT